MATEKKNKKRKMDEGGTISCRCSARAAIDDIKMCLSPDDNEEFSKSCFGPFLRLRNLMFQGNLSYYLLRRLDPTSQAQGVMKFKFEGMDGFFGPDHYIAITGLSFADEPAQIPNSSVIHQTVFNGRTDISLKDVQEALLRLSSYDNDQGQKALKIALVYLLYAALMSKGSSHKKLDLKYLHLVDDLKQFNAYPWGRVSYNYLLREHYVCASRIRKHLQAGRNPVVELLGFSPALQIWAYEIFPMLGDRCAQAVGGGAFEAIRPRMLRWVCEETNSLRAITNDIEQRGILAMVAHNFNYYKIYYF